MAGPIPRIDATQFDRVASSCRWSARSLDVARAVLVDGDAVAEAATTHDMTAKQARVLVHRFVAKVEQHRLQSFMQQEAPKLAGSALEPFASELRTLRDKGYTIAQIVAYLETNGIQSSATSVRRFLRSIGA